jgi:hypothetical protein
LPRLANVATKLPNHVPWRPVLADQKPTSTVAIGRSAAYGRRVLPDQLREVADFVRELALLVVVVALFVGPAVDGEGGSRIALGQVFAVGPTLENALDFPEVFAVDCKG